MAKTHTILCAKCSQPYETVRANTVVCPICRLYLDLIYLGPRTAKCWVCEQEFAPLERNEKACVKHMYEARKHGDTECAFCHETKLRIRADVAVCNTCARRPELRGKLISSLERKVHQRSEAAA